MDQDEAEQIAIGALTFITSEPNTLERFLALSGLESQDLRAAADESGFLGGVLDFVCSHEPALLAFAASKHLSPETVDRARLVLSGPIDH